MKKDFWKVEVLHFLGTKDWELVTDIRVLRAHSRPKETTDGWFRASKHLLFERVKFGFANQAENESIDQYVVRLRQLTESCEFVNLRA